MLRAWDQPGGGTRFRRWRYPLRYQIEEADCGPACLEMISAFHGAARSQSHWRRLAHVRVLGSLLSLPRGLDTRIGESGIRRADVIVVLEHGRVLEQGTHAELLQREGGA